MKQAAIYSAFFVGGVLVTLLAILFGRGDIELWSISQEYPVVTKREFIVSDEAGRKITLPAGTSLMFESQYSGAGTYSLELVSSDLDNFEKSEDQQIYFEETE